MAIQYYQNGITQFRYNNITEAAIQLQKAIELEPKYIEAYFALGEISYKLIQKEWYKDQPGKIGKYHEKAFAYFGKIIKLCPKYYDYQSYYYLGRLHFETENYRDARKNLLQFMKNSRISFNEKQDVTRMLDNINMYFYYKNNPVSFNPVMLEGVCTAEDEYLPLLSTDGEYLFYTRRYKQKNETLTSEKIVEEFGFSKRLNLSTESVDTFSAYQPMPYPFNEGKNQGAVSISIDNNHLFITICQLEHIGYTSYNNCDIYTSDFVDGSWSSLKRLGSNINTNSSFEAQPSISPDGKTLYFVSARDGGYGGLDIYKSEKNKNQGWSPAKNLGPAINTAKNDKTPFIHSDNHTLYFASDGHFGFGGFDIFHSKYNNGKWTKPVNIGYPINTEGDELGFIVSTNGQRVYFSSNNLKGKGGWDIFSADLPEEARPKQVLFVKGQLFDESGNSVTDARVDLQNVKTLKLTRGLVDTKTGKYAVAVAVVDEDDFILTVKKDGNFFDSKYIKPNEEDLTNPPTTVNFEIKPIKVGTKIKLENIYFASNSSVFNKNSIVALNNFVEFLKMNPTVKISLYGHTDNVGSNEWNMQLSVARAQAVYTYLLEHGVGKTRMTYKGFGKTRPVATNETTEGRAANRRTEFVITVK